MNRKVFKSDKDGRIPFALVAVLLLVMSSFLSGLIANLNGVGYHRTDNVTLDLPPGMTVIEQCIKDQAVRAASLALEDGFGRGLEIDKMWIRLPELFGVGLYEKITAALEVEGIKGWEIAVDEKVIGIDLRAFPNGKVVGTVNWTATSSKGMALRGSTDVSEGLDRPWALTYTVQNRLELSGDEGGELAGYVKGMLFRLAAVRTANGELDGKTALSPDDVSMALGLALALVMNGSKKGSAGSDDPSDLILDALNITTVRSSSVLAQYLVGLLDYYLLWFRDYSGIGERAESFFQWIGQGTEENQDLSEAREKWYEELRVQYLVERWAFQVLASVLHMVLERSGDDVIDIQDLRLDEISKRVQTGVNETGEMVVEALENGVPLGDGKTKGLAPPADLSRALKALPTSRPEEYLDIADRLKDAVETATLRAIGGLVNMASGLANRALEELITVDELQGFSQTLPVPLMDPFNGSEDKGRLKVSSVAIEWSDLSFKTTIQTAGVHDTAPEERLRRVMSAAMEPGHAVIFTEIRPYETDYRIEVKGALEVHRLVFHRLDRLTNLGSSEHIELRFTVPINLSFTVPVLTGVPLSGIDYDPSETLYGDLAEAAWGFVNWTWAALGWAAGTVRGLVEDLAGGVRELGRRGLENLGRMNAGNLSRVVENVLKALYAKAWNGALNISWRLLRDLIGADLREMLTFDVVIMGFDLTVQLDLFSEMLTISHRQDGFSFTLAVKRLAEENPPFRPMPIEGYDYALLGTVSLQRGRLSIFASLDPLTVIQPYVLQIVGESRDTSGRGFRFELDAPVAERVFRSLTVSLSSVLGSALKRVPIPGTGLTFDIDAGLRIRYGPGVLAPEKLLVRALRAAWYKTLEGYSVKELFEDWADMVLLEAFIIHLLNNIANRVEDIASQELPELELFIDGRVSAAVGTLAMGFSLSFVLKEPVKVIWATIPWMVDNLKMFLMHMVVPGLPVVQTEAPSTVLERLYVRGTVLSEIGLPDVFGGERLGKVGFGAVMEANLPALGTLIGKDVGRWMFRTGVLMPDLPSAVAAMVPGLDPPRPKCDLWLFRLSVMELDNDKARLSEVYYDTAGKDAMEEFIEIWNPTKRIIDMSRWVIVDQGGKWTLPDHLEISPGARLVVARNRDGFRSEFKALPDVSGLTLSLNNDGDLLELYDPWGVRIDSVAWEGGAHGWNLKCKSGQSLQRNMFDTDTPKDWHCGSPDPGR